MTEEEVFMSIPKKDLEKILHDAFPNAQIKVTALIDDGDHYSVEIIDEIFTGKTRIEQHKIVNAALKEILGGALHAMQLRTSDK
ncbi:MAG: BolA/IbaG family iron-sulfur metabolism protein [Rickettsiales bacterium]|nr:BolA/IbaG family iron-sulfur metabolism protein [Rickettsiales bacterium]